MDQRHDGDQREDDAGRALRLDREYVMHSWSSLSTPRTFALAGGSGSTVWDHDGRRYLDFSSQLVNTNIGHQHPRVIAAIQEQAGRLATVAPSTVSSARGEAAERILARAGEPFSRVFFTNGGADANENAIRMARLSTGRDTILSTYRSYHGNTGAAIVATGDWRRMPNQFARGHVHFFGPFPFRSEFWSDSPEQETERALHHLERVIQSEGPDTIAAVLLETVPGTAGVIVPPPGYLEGVRELTERYGILLILDEVMAGFGRTGGWFAFHSLAARESTQPVVPDLVTVAKGVNSGYVPAGAVIVGEQVAAYFADRVFPGGLTYSGHPLAMAAIVATIDAMTDEGIVENAEMIGTDHLGPGLAALADRHPSIGDVRGLGVFWALDLVADRSTKAPVDASTMTALKSAFLERGLLPFVQDNRVHVVPPCVVTVAEVERALTIYDEALDAVSL